MGGEPLTSAELMDDTARVAAHRARGLFFLGFAIAAVGFTMAIQQGVNANFLRQVMGLEGEQVGILEATRESCGIFALGLLALLAGFAEPVIAAIVLIVVGLGIGAYAYVPTFGWLVIGGLVWSQGLHIWMPLPNSMTLAMAEPGRAGHRLGQMQAAGAAGAMLGFLAALLMVKLGVSMRQMYLPAGAMAILAAVFCLAIPRGIKTPGPRLIFRRKYGLYYLLCFLEGWRKQIALAFAGFLLVDQFQTSLETLLILYVIIQIISWLTSPMAGRIIDRLGERPVLVFYYAALTVIFAAYALVRSELALYVIFILNNAILVLSIGLNTYVNHIAPKSEHTPTLSMGVAVNHISSVTMPLIGGFLWKYAGYEWTFIAGSIAAVLSILPVLLLPSKANRPAAANTAAKH